MATVQREINVRVCDICKRDMSYDEPVRFLALGSSEFDNPVREMNVKKLDLCLRHSSQLVSGVEHFLNAGTAASALALGPASVTANGNANGKVEHVTAAPKVKPTPKAKPKAKTSKAKAKPKAESGTTADIRAWARENGYTVAERGRIPVNITAKYATAH